MGACGGGIFGGIWQIRIGKTRMDRAFHGFIRMSLFEEGVEPESVVRNVVTRSSLYQQT